jgi:hypothetical protein
MRNIFVVVFLLLVAFGCGGDTESETKTETETSMKIPIKIDVEMPKVITVSDDEYREHLGEQEKTSAQRLEDENNYREVKPITLTIEQRFDETKFNIAMVNSIMDKIEERCKDTPLNKVCKIPKGNIEFSFDKQIVDELIGFVSRKRISAVDTESLIGESTYFGSIEFVNHDENSTYAYSLMMESSDIENMFFSIEKSKPYIKTIRWSKDNRKIFYSSLVDSERTTVYYQNIPNIGERAYLTSFTFTETPFVSNTHIFDLSREENSTDFLLNIKTVDIDRIHEIQRFYQKHSYLQISEENGYCSTDFYNRFPEISFDENNMIQEYYYNSTMDMSHQVFDKNGTIEATRYCAPFANAIAGDFSAHRECKYEDITTWTTYSDNELLFRPFDKLYFREIMIGMNFSTEEGYLRDGEYFLLPPKLSVTNLTMEDVLKHSVASFVVIDGLFNVIYGFVYDKRYADMYDESVHKKLNEFQIVYAKYNHDLNLSLAKRVKEFEVLSDEAKPDIW